MIKLLYLDVSDVIPTNKHTKYANCGLDVNFRNFLLMPFCFMIKKDHFQQRLLLWHQVPFKKICLYHLGLPRSILETKIHTVPATLGNSRSRVSVCQ